MLLLLVVSGVWYANNQHNLEDNPREEETNNLQETIIHTPVDTIKKYPSLALNDLAQLRLHPDQTSKIEQKGYYLIASKDNIRTFVGTLCDTVIINKKWVNDIVKISWQAGTNRHWLYNRMRAEMRKKYPYSEMLSNNDETDNELKGLQYFKDECYVDDGGIQYRVIVTYSKGKVIGYGLEVNADY